MYTFFANSGLQYIYTDIELPEANPTNDWALVNKDYLWVKYRTTKVLKKIILCIDTGTGVNGHICESEEKLGIRNVEISLSNIGVDSNISLEIIASSAGTGDPKNASLVLDFGNSRSVGLIVEEDRDNSGHMLPARPFEYDSKYMKWLFDSENPQDIESASSQTVFESSFCFVDDNVPSQDIKIKTETEAVYEEQPRSGIAKLVWGGTKTVMISPPKEIEIIKDSGLFINNSPVRMGKVVRTLLDTSKYYYEAGKPLVGLSGPKRYLWDNEPLRDGKYWHQFNMKDEKMTAINGRYFRHVTEDDKDWNIVPNNSESTEFNPSPRYPKRSMITACIYDLLEKVYSQINSIEYRSETPDPRRKRNLSHLVMSYPSALSHDEKRRYKIQVQKAIDIFSHMHGISSDEAPKLRMNIDEGMAGQLAYVYGEIQAFSTAEDWLRISGNPVGDGSYKTRIATIDIGGGTSDLVISDFQDKAPGPSTSLLCELLYVDGANKAGDDILTSVIQKIIIPQVASQAGLTRDQTRRLFENITDQDLVERRKSYLAEIWVPLANTFIGLANGKDGSSFNLGEIITDPKVMTNLEEDMDRVRGNIIIEELADFVIKYRKKDFEDVLYKLLQPALASFCDAITRFDCDLVTLAGRPSDLVDIQNMVKEMLPLSKNRIIPMGSYRTGAWYPLQSAINPGCIADPKSVVVVGCAIDHLSRVTDSLGSMRVEIERSIISPQTYYWGQVNRGQRSFRNNEAIFKANDSFDQKTAEIAVVGGEFIIARRLTSKNKSEPIPTYALRCKKGRPSGYLYATLECKRINDDIDEVIELKSLSGKIEIDGIEVEAKIGEHVDLVPRGMIENQHFLDDGVFFEIDYDKISE